MQWRQRNENSSAPACERRYHPKCLRRSGKTRLVDDKKRKEQQQKPTGASVTIVLLHCVCMQHGINAPQKLAVGSCICTGGLRRLHESLQGKQQGGWARKSGLLRAELRCDSSFSLRPKDLFTRNPALHSTHTRCRHT